jgi:hypothetical protein
MVLEVFVLSFQCVYVDISLMILYYCVECSVVWNLFVVLNDRSGKEDGERSRAIIVYSRWALGGRDVAVYIY